MEAKDSIKRLSISQKDSRIYLIGELLGDSSIKSLMDILTCYGEQGRKTQIIISL